MANNILGGLTGLPPNMTPQDWARITDTTAVINNDPLNVTKATPKKTIGEMKRYKVKEDIYAFAFGEKKIKFKKGDIVESDNVNDGGIYAPPTHNADRGIVMDMVFIPLSKLTQLSGTPNEPSNMFPVTNDDNTKLLQ